VGASVSRTTRLTRHIAGPRAAVYRALLDRDAVRLWMVPDGMTSEVHAFDPRVGGGFRISLTYDAPDAAGKSVANTDTHHGVFTELVADEKVVQVIAFETDDPTMAGDMTVTYSLSDSADGGTELVGVHENLPVGVSLADNELGWRIALDKLAALVESA